MVRQYSTARNTGVSMNVHSRPEKHSVMLFLEFSLVLADLYSWIYI